MRTYYTGKLITSPDLSYNLIAMGLWTNAEIGVGIIVSCLPMLPRFCKHVSPKVKDSLSFRCKGETITRPKSGFAVADGMKIPVSLKRHFAKSHIATIAPKIWNHPDTPTARLGDADILVNVHDSSKPPQRELASESIQTRAEGPITRQEDLEMGQDGIRVVQTMHLHWELNTEGLTTSQLYEQPKDW